MRPRQLRGFLLFEAFAFFKIMSKAQRRWSSKEDAILREEIRLQTAGMLSKQMRMQSSCGSI